MMFINDQVGRSLHTYLGFMLVIFMFGWDYKGSNIKIMPLYYVYIYIYKKSTLSLSVYKYCNLINRANQLII